MISARFPKAELHCHIEGAADAGLVQSQARKYGADVSSIISAQGEYFWTDFTDFLKAYDLAASLFRTGDDYALLAETYLADLARQGAIHSEIFISTDHAISAGLDPAEYVDGLARGIAGARRTHGIECRMIATGLRHKGPSAVLEAARWIVSNPHPLVTGFGMAGDERMHRAKDFRAAFDHARDAGLGITTHAGELCGPDSVAESIEWLRPSRIGHGVRAIEDPALVDAISKSGIVLEVCPVSNVVLGVYADFADHPFPALRAAGCRVTLSSDDPPHFHTSLQREYEIAASEFGLDDEALLQCTRTSIEAAFIDGETRAVLLEKCKA